MNKQKIVWSWFDGEGTYANQAESLQEIIQEVVEYYHREEAEVTVKNCGSHFEVQIFDELRGSINVYESKMSNSAVSEFLGMLAKLEGRPDKFHIDKIA